MDFFPVSERKNLLNEGFRAKGAIICVSFATVLVEIDAFETATGDIGVFVNASEYKFLNHVGIDYIVAVAK